VIADQLNMGCSPWFAEDGEFEDDSAPTDPTPTEGAAPAATDAGAPSSLPDTSSAQPASVAASPAPAADKPFDWDAWDGASDDAVPEQFRPGLARLRAVYEPRLGEVEAMRSKLEGYDALQAQAREAEALRIQLQALGTGEPDPELATLRSDITNMTAQLEEHRSRADVAEANFVRAYEAYQQLQAALAEEAFDNLVAKHPHVAANEEALQFAGKLMQADIEPDVAMEMAATKFNLEKAPPSDAAFVTSGAAGRPGAASYRPASPRLPHAEMLDQVVKQQFDKRRTAH